MPREVELLMWLFVGVLLFVILGEPFPKFNMINFVQESFYDGIYHNIDCKAIILSCSSLVMYIYRLLFQELRWPWYSSVISHVQD